MSSAPCATLIGKVLMLHEIPTPPHSRQRCFIALFLVLLLLLSLAPTAFAGSTNACAEPCTHEAAIGSTHYDTLREAVDDVTEGNPSPTSIILLRDVEKGIGVLFQSGKNISLDFKGHSYTVTGGLVGSKGTETNGFQLLKGSNITFQNGSIYLSDDVGCAYLLQNYTDLKLENMQIDISNNDYCEAALHSMHGYVQVLGDTSIKNSGDYVWSPDKVVEMGEKKSVATMDWSANSEYTAGTQVVIDTTGILEGQIYSSAYSSKSGQPQKTSSTTIINANVIGDVVESKYVSESEYGVKFEIKGGQFNGELRSESKPPKLSISAGTFATDVQAFVESDATLAKVSFGNQTKYLAGEASDVASQIQRLSSLSSVEVLQGGLTLSGLPGGVSVTNKNDGSVIANGQTIPNGESLQIPHPKPIAGVVVSGGEEEQPGGEEDGSQETAPTYAVICRKLNVRSGPGTSYDRIGSLSRGALLSGVLEDGWLRFTYNGQTAYVSATYVQKLNGSGDLCVLCNALNVRTGPSTSYAKLGQLLSGTYVDPLESQNGWYKIGYNGGYGWICADYVG